MNITLLKQGSLNGLRRQINECLDSAYNKGYEDGNKIADKDLKEIQDSTYDVAYNKALKDVNHALDVLKDMTVTECAEWFEDCEEIVDVVCTFTIERIVESTKAYEEKKKTETEIKVGDEVFINGCSRNAIVTRVLDNDLYNIVFYNGDTNCVDRPFIGKTGRHFDEIEQLLDKLKESED